MDSLPEQGVIISFGTPDLSPARPEAKKAGHGFSHLGTRVIAAGSAMCVWPWRFYSVHCGVAHFMGPDTGEGSLLGAGVVGLEH
jgi:hypothetical protein